MKKKQQRGDYYELTAHAVVVPQQVAHRPFWGAQHLGTGSVVQMLPNTVSPITGQENEITVRWLDVGGRESIGWLAHDTPMKPAHATKRLKRASNDDRAVSAWDALRYRIGGNAGWDTRTWICRFGKTHLPLLHAVIRQLGGRMPNTDDPFVAIQRSIKLITGKEITMSAATATAAAHTSKGHHASSKKASTKKSNGKKGATKKAAKKNGTSAAGRTSMFAGKRITFKAKENPRRAGSTGHRNWNHYKKGATYEQYIAAGGLRGCLAKDVERGNIKLGK